MLLEAEARGYKFESAHRCAKCVLLRKHMDYLPWDSICNMFQSATGGIKEQLEYIRDNDAIADGVVPQEASEVGSAGARCFAR